MQRSQMIQLTLLGLIMLGAFAVTSYVSTPIIHAQEDFRSLKKDFKQAKKDLSRTRMERAVKAMGKLDDPDACKFLIEELEDDQKARQRDKAGLPGEIRDEIIKALSNFTNKDCVKMVCDMALELDSEDDPTLALDQFDFFKALADMTGSAKADETVRAALAHEDNAYIKCAALEAVRQTGAARFFDDVVSILGEDNDAWAEKWLIVPINVLACIEEIVEREETQKVIRVVDAVIAWETDKNCDDERVAFFGGKMLRKLTGETADMGSVRFWTWWVEQMRSVGKVNTTKKPEGKRSKTAVIPPVFDAAPVGKRFVFVIDLSLSMEKPLKITIDEIEDRKKKRGPVSGKRDGDEEKEEEEKEDENPLRQLPWRDIESKIDLAREELARAIKSFVGDRLFAIVVYSTEVEVITDGWVKATPGNCRKWAKEAQELEVEALTNIHGSLKRAMQISDEGTETDEPAVDEDCVLTGADTIIFLTDGWATWSDDSVNQDAPEPRGGDALVGDGDFIRGEDIWPDIVRINLFRKVIINTVGIGYHDQKLLQNLSGKTGGTYVDWGFPEN